VFLPPDRLHALRTRPRPAFRPRLERLEGRDTPSTTVLDVAPNPATFLQAVTLTATITEGAGDSVQPGNGSPTQGTVTFFDGVAALMTIKVTPKAGTTTQGVAQFTTTLGLGTHSLTAQYSGDAIPAALRITSASASSAVSATVSLPPPPPGPVDVTPFVSVVVHRRPPGKKQLVTVTNDSGLPITGPLYLVFTRLPRRVRLRGASGVAQSHGVAGSPFLLDAVTLPPDGHANFLASFSGRKAVRFTTEVFAGTGSL
jgi:hypothetical protein